MSNENDKGGFNGFLADLIRENIAQVKTGLVCKIEKFDKALMRADVKPVYKYKDENDIKKDFAIVKNVPVKFIFDGNFYIRPDYQPGTLVWCSFSHVDTYKALREFSDIRSDKLFSAENMSVDNAVAKTNWTAPAEFSSESGLLIGHKDGNSFMLYGSDKITFKFGINKMEFSATGVKITVGATTIDLDAGGVKATLAGGLSYNLATHQHPGSMGPPIPGT